MCGHGGCFGVQPTFLTPPFIHSPSHGSGCLGRLLWPWGAWLSLWSLLPGIDCPPAHLDPNLCSPTSPRLPVHCPPWPSHLLWVGGARIEGHTPQQAGRTEALKGDMGYSPGGGAPLLRTQLSLFHIPALWALASVFPSH